MRQSADRSSFLNLLSTNPPRLRIGEAEKEPRHATWLELFYDPLYSSSPFLSLRTSSAVRCRGSVFWAMPDCLCRYGGHGSARPLACGGCTLKTRWVKR